MSFKLYLDCYVANFGLKIGKPNKNRNKQTKKKEIK